MISIRRQISADLKLLNRRVMWIIGLVFVIVSAMMVWITRRSAGNQLSIIDSGLQTSGVDPHSTQCNIYAGMEHISGCLSQISPDVELTFPQSMIEYYPAVVEASTLTSSPAGLLTVAARHSGTMLGLMTLILVVALHTSATWEGGTARWLLPRIGLSRFLIVKLVTMACVALILPILGWAGSALGLLIPTGQALPPGTAPWGTAMEQVGLSWVVLLLIGTLVLGISAWARALVTGFVITCGVMALSFFGSLDRELYKFSPAGWIATMLKLPVGPYRQTVDYLWIGAGPDVSMTLSYLGLLAMALVPLFGAIIWLRRARPLA